MPDSLSPAAARRVLLAAQGFGARPTTAGTRQLNLQLARLRLLQLDSVNVYERSHYLPVFARLGAYDKELLDRLTFARRSATARSDYTEQWAHEAAVVPVEDWPLLAWRREAFRAKHAEWFRDNARILDWLRAELAAKGPLTSGQIEHEDNVRNGPWWGWSATKQGLEMLFRSGEVAIAGRTRFQRRYALAETVNGYYKAELIRGPARTGPWKTVEDVELATLSWVHWHNTSRLHGYLADRTPAEFEAAFYAAQQATPAGVGNQ